MRVIALNTVSLSGKYYKPGDTFNCDGKTLDHLFTSGAVSPIEDPAKKESSNEDKDASIKELTQIDAVDEKLAAILYSAGYATLDKVATLDVTELAKIKGIGKSTAEKIYNSFDVEE